MFCLAVDRLVPFSGHKDPVKLMLAVILALWHLSSLQRTCDSRDRHLSSAEFKGRTCSGVLLVTPSLKGWWAQVGEAE